MSASSVHLSAIAAADRAVPDRTSTEPCSTCNGTARMAVAGVSIDCVYCKKTGRCRSWDREYAAAIHCDCKYSPAIPIFAKDGPAVFGNTTYLCGTCKKVSSFG